jgi:hypothetical protein
MKPRRLAFILYKNLNIAYKYAPSRIQDIQTRLKVFQKVLGTAFASWPEKRIELKAAEVIKEEDSRLVSQYAACSQKSISQSGTNT